MEQEEDLAIDPDVLHYANEQISARLGTLVYQVHVAAAQPKADTIHDLRVAIRRFLQSLEVFSSLLPKPAVKKIRKRLRRILNLSAAIRDRDIALELLSEAGLGKKEPLCRSVVADRRAAEDALARRVKRLHSSDFSAKWRAALEINRP